MDIIPHQLQRLPHQVQRFIGSPPPAKREMVAAAVVTVAAATFVTIGVLAFLRSRRRQAIRAQKASKRPQIADQRKGRAAQARRAEPRTGSPD